MQFVDGDIPCHGIIRYFLGYNDTSMADEVVFHQLTFREVLFPCDLFSGCPVVLKNRARHGSDTVVRRQNFEKTEQLKWIWWRGIYFNMHLRRLCYDATAPCSRTTYNVVWHYDNRPNYSRFVNMRFEWVFMIHIYYSYCRNHCPSISMKLTGFVVILQSVRHEVKLDTSDADLGKALQLNTLKLLPTLKCLNYNE